MKVWETRGPTMVAYCLEVHRLEGKFDGLELHHVHWCDNKAADALTRMGSNHELVLPGVFLQHLW